MASTMRRTTSTFSWDITYSESPAASRASARSKYSSPRTSLPSRIVKMIARYQSAGTPLARPSRVATPRKDAAVPNVDVFLDIDVHPIKALQPLLQVALVGLQPSMGCGVGVFRRRLPFDVW